MAHAAYDITVEELRQWFDYSEKTGDLWWIKRPSCASKILRPIRGKNDAKEGCGYYTVSWRGFGYRVHKIIWALHHGAWPPEGLLIDHINTDRLDNRPANLRLATRSQNGVNRKKSWGGTSRYKNVHFHENGYWVAGHHLNKKFVHIGIFTTEENARQAALEYGRHHFGEFYREE